MPVSMGLTMRKRLFGNRLSMRGIMDIEVWENTKLRIFLFL
jgi:hypothetical protein